MIMLCVIVYSIIVCSHKGLAILILNNFIHAVHNQSEKFLNVTSLLVNRLKRGAL